MHCIGSSKRQGELFLSLVVHKNLIFNQLFILNYCFFQEPLSLGKELVKVGFGTVQDTKALAVSDKDIEVYRKSLQLAQKWAERKRNGIWQQKYSPTIVWKMRNILDDKLKLILPIPLVKYFNI